MYFKELYGNKSNRLIDFLSWIWRHTFARLGEDWVFLALLGIIMAILSYIMDVGITLLSDGESSKISNQTKISPLI